MTSSMLSILFGRFDALRADKADLQKAQSAFAGCKLTFLASFRCACAARVTGIHIPSGL
jgi:hypothetical protein